MVSLRNINTLLVFDPKSEKIKFYSVGRFLRQHDPDFMPGDKISVLDNRNLFSSDGSESLSSRILEIDVKDGSAKVVLQGKGANNFFTRIMGVHQRLENGNILLASSIEGRVIEYAPDGTIVWYYHNRFTNNQNARVFMAKLLPLHMDAEFFKKCRSTLYE